MGKIVVTGVSTGIGHGVLNHFVSKGFHVFGSVRSRKDGQKLKKKYKDSFTPLIFDVTKESQIKSAVGLVKKNLKNENILALVNNAGIGLGGPILHLPTKDFERQIDVNLNGAFRVIKYFTPLLGAQKNNNYKKGVIFNISSVVGKYATPGNAAYCASKHGLEAISHSLRRELLKYGVDVVIIRPGPIKTEIFKKIDKKAMNRLKKTDYSSAAKNLQKRFKAMEKIAFPSDDVAKLIYTALHNKRRKTSYVITPNRFTFWTLPMILSDRLLDRALRRMN